MIVSVLTTALGLGTPVVAPGVGMTLSSGGRDGDAKVEFTASGSNPESCTVAISGPGVKQEIVVDYDGSASVGSIAADNAEIVDVYNVSGQKLSGNLPAGLYIMRDSNGKVYKRTIK